MLDELVGEHALVRVIDAWVGKQDMAALAFEKAKPQVRGAPPYDPSDLLKLYVWGYLNGVRSSRSLERECHRNVECMWLLGRLAPDHKTIAEFRRRNTTGLIAACAAFVAFARACRLVAGRTVAIDGSKVRAVASRKAILSQKVLEQRARRNSAEVADYLKLLDEQDRQEGAADIREEDVRQALQRLEREGAEIAAQQDQLAAAGKATLVQSEPEAQVMRSLHKAPGYNLQTAVDTETHLIVHHDVCADANDLQQLEPMALGAAAALPGVSEVLADAGYANGEHIASLGKQGIVTFVAPNGGGNNRGSMDKSHFTFDARHDHYVCPGDKLLVRQRALGPQQGVVYAASPQDCGSCGLKPACTTAASRSVTRHPHEEALQANAARVQSQPQRMATRRETVEHPFGSLKTDILRNARLLMRGLPGAKGELSIAVLAYNIKRAFNLKGSSWMRAALQG